MTVSHPFPHGRFRGLALLLTLILSLIGPTPLDAQSATEGPLPTPQAFTEVAAGQTHSCGLTADGTAYCWGGNGSGQVGDGTQDNRSEPVAVDVSGFVTTPVFTQITAGRVHSCAISSTGEGYCWGAGSSGQLGNNATADQLTPSQVTGPNFRSLTQISAGDSHTCALDSDGEALCWGLQSDGRVGNGLSTGLNDTPQLVTAPGGRTFKDISAGTTHSCGIATDGTAYCWGSEANGRLGNGSTTGLQSTPVAVSDPAVGTTWTQISAGMMHSCGVTTTGTAFCWGDDDGGRLGIGGTTGDESAPQALTGLPSTASVAAVEAGGSHSCAVSGSGDAYCWGSGFGGQLGIGGVTNIADVATPVDIAGLATGAAFVQISVGFFHTCATTAEGLAYCWGTEQFGRLGNGQTNGEQRSPAAVVLDAIPLGESFVEVSVGNRHACGVTGSGLAYCWGDNARGQLGDATTADRSVPTLVSVSTMTGSQTFVSISAGNAFTCGVAGDGAAYCWGSGTGGQLGYGGLADRLVPQRVDTNALPTGMVFAEVTAGANYACGIAGSGTGYCWGNNSQGRLGIGTTAIQELRPTAIDAATLSDATFVQLSTDSHSCGIAGDGVAYCWGDGGLGRLGNGTTAGNQLSPDAVDTSTLLGEESFVDISTGSAFSCGITGDGLAYCFGHEPSGQLGNGAGISEDQASPSPVDTTPLGTSKGFIGVDAGTFHSCGLTGDGVARCWGNSANGQLGGVGGGTQRSPAAVDSGLLSDGFFHQVEAGGFSCGVSGSGIAACWGRGADGEVGNGGTENATRPTPVVLAVDVALQDVVAEVGEEVTFQPVLTGTGPAFYSWTLDGTPISGESDSTYTRTLTAADNDSTVGVIVSNPFGQTASDTGRIRVLFDPIADAGGPYDVREDGTVELTASGSDPDGGTVTFAWDLDDNGTFETDGQSATFTPTGPGSATVTVRVTDDEDVAVTDATQVRVSALPEPTSTPTSDPTPRPTPTDQPTMTPTDVPVPEPTVAVLESVSDADDPIAAAIDISNARFDEAAAPSDGAAVRLAQQNRYADAVVLARVDVFADALTGSALTGTAPMLFTPQAALDSRTAAEIDRALQGSGPVYLLGGEVALSAQIATELTESGYTPVRLAGASRFETAVAIAEQTLSLGAGSTPTPQVGIARAFGPEDNPTAAWVDAIAAGGWAAETGQPILLTATDSLHPAVAAWLTEHTDHRPAALGLQAAVSDATLAAADVLTDQEAIRVGGTNRFATAATIASTLWTAPSGDFVVAGATETDGWAYALAVAGYAADTDRPILLTEPGRLPMETDIQTCLDGDRADVSFVGSVRHIGSDVRDQLTGSCTQQP